MKPSMSRQIAAHLFRVWMIGASLATPATAQTHTRQGHRLPVGAGTLLLVPDSQTGVTIWARRDTRPGHRPTPDFVGWFAPESVEAWIAVTRQLLAGPRPLEGDAIEGTPLVALDQGRMGLMQTGDSVERRFGLTFGHPREHQRWLIEATATEIGRLLDSLALLARTSRLAPPAGLTYANPTHRAVTPDRKEGVPPRVTGDPGEIWATMVLDEKGRAIGGTTRVLWATRPALADAVLAVLPGYRYARRDGRREGLVVYQRFRVSGAR
jgi:hypothetical protein